MDYYAIHAAGIQSVQDEQGSTCPALWYSGKLIPICPGGALFKSSNSPGGFSLDSDLQLTVLVLNFGAGFDLNSLDNQTFNYPGQNGDLYRVANIIKSPNNFQVRIVANNAAEGL